MTSNKEMLLNQLGDSGARTKLSAKFSGFVRDRLRESSFAVQILPEETIDRSQCQISTQHEALVKLVHLEPRSRAMVVTFRGSPNANFIRGERVEVPFITIMSDLFQKTEQEFMAYDYPIGKVIEQNAVRDIGEVQDREFLIHVEAGIQALQTEANGGVPTALNPTSLASGAAEFSVVKGEMARIASGTFNHVALPLQRPDLVRLFKLLDGNRLESHQILITTVDWDDVLQWTMEDQGSPLQSETAVHGWRSNLLLGKKYIRTIKTDILRPGNVYCFTQPDFLGKFYVLNQTKFYIDKYINLVKFVAWRDIGMSIVNIASARKLETYSGDANPSTDQDNILGSVVPEGEENLGRQNNRAGNRQFYPSMVSLG